MGGVGDTQQVDIVEFNNLKAQKKFLMRREAELQEEIDKLKHEAFNSNFTKGLKNVLERSKSRGRQENNGIASNNGGNANANNTGTSFNIT